MKKVSAVARIDSLDDLQQFDKANHNIIWYCIRDAYDVRPREGTVYFDTYNEQFAKQVLPADRKVAVIGFSVEIAAVGLIPEADLPKLKDMLGKPIIEVSTFNLKW